MPKTNIKMSYIMPKTMPKYFLTIPKHLWKVEKNDIFNPKIVIITSLEGQDLTKNLKLRGHLATFGAEKIPTSWPCKSKNNAHTLPEQRPNNLQKVKKTGFLALKSVKMTISTLSSWHYLVRHFELDKRHFPKLNNSTRHLLDTFRTDEIFINKKYDFKN